MPEDYLRDLWNEPLTDAQKEARAFAAQTEEKASSLPGHWLMMITQEDKWLLSTLGMFWL